MDRLTSLSVFVAAVEEGSLAAAARRHGLSASMAGKHLAALEAELKTRLLQRSTRRLGLTQAGQAYYARGKRILDDYEEAKREAGDAQGEVSGLLRVAAPFTFGEMRLGDVIARFMAAYPKVTLDIVLSDRYADLVAEGLDLAIRIGRLPDSDLVARRLGSCRMVFCAAPALLALYGMPVTVEDLRLLPRLAFGEAVSAGDWTLSDAEGASHVIDGPVRMRANNMRLLLSAALSGAGIAYGPSFVFEDRLAAGDLVLLLPDHRTADLAIQAVYPSNRHVPLRLRRFVEHLAAELAERAP